MSSIIYAAGLAIGLDYYTEAKDLSGTISWSSPEEKSRITARD